MKEVDYHGYTLEDAIKHLESIINTHYLNKEIQTYRLITGHGVIKKKFLILLKDYDCDASIELGNSGAIIAHIDLEVY